MQWAERMFIVAPAATRRAPLTRWQHGSYCCRVERAA